MIHETPLGRLSACVLALAGCAAGPDAPDRAEPAAAPGGAAPSEAAQAVTPDAPAGGGWEALAAWAEGRNPALMAERRRRDAARSRVTAARAFPDPELQQGLYLERGPADMDRARARIGVMQPVPWLGTRGLRGRVAQGEAEAALARLEAARWQLRGRVAAAWLELRYVERAAGITDEALGLVADAERVARARYRAAAAGHPDVLRAQVELARLENALASTRDRRRSALAALNALLDRDPAAELFPAGEVRPRPPAADEVALRALLYASPELAVPRWEAQAAREEAGLARREAWPEATVGLERMDMVEADSREDPLALTLSLRLPLWEGRTGALRREARSRYRAARAEVAARRRELEAALEASLYERRDAERRADLYGRTLVPKAEESLAAVRRAYETGTAAFTDLVDAERLLLEFRLAWERAVADHETGRAEIERILGRVLE
ncbi:MAG: TolC family protein [Planctomycetes bacterium]|nr:TolC family protein [Planctomycetota bacterium]